MSLNLLLQNSLWKEMEVEIFQQTFKTSRSVDLYARSLEVQSLEFLALESLEVGKDGKNWLKGIFLSPQWIRSSGEWM